MKAKSVADTKRARIALMTGEWTYVSAVMSKKDGFSREDAEELERAASQAEDEDSFFFSCEELARRHDAAAVTERPVRTSAVSPMGVADFTSNATKALRKKGLTIVVNATGCDYDAVVPSRQMAGTARAERWPAGAAIWLVDGEVAAESPIGGDAPEGPVDGAVETAVMFRWDEWTAKDGQTEYVINLGAANALVKVANPSNSKKAFVVKDRCDDNVVKGRIRGGRDVEVYSFEGRLWSTFGIRDVGWKDEQVSDVATWTKLAKRRSSVSYMGKTTLEACHSRWVETNRAKKQGAPTGPDDAGREAAAAEAVGDVEGKVVFVERGGGLPALAASDKGRPVYLIFGGFPSLSWMEDNASEDEKEPDGARSPVYRLRVPYFECDEKEALFDWVAKECAGTRKKEEAMKTARELDIEILDPSCLEKRRRFPPEVAEALAAGMPEKFAMDAQVRAKLTEFAPCGAKAAAWAADAADFEKKWVAHGGDADEVFAAIADPDVCVALPNGGGAVMYEKAG